MSNVYLHVAGNKLLVSFDYNPHIVSKIKKIPGVRWIKEMARWEAGFDAYDRLVGELDNLIISKGVMEKLAEQARLKIAVDELRKKEYHEIEDYSPKLPLMSHQKKAFELHRMLQGSGNFSEMGSGKCLAAKDLQLVNGELLEAEKVWEEYAVNPIFDGEGWWATPKKALTIVSLDGSGALTKKEVKKLYKQKISEKVRQIRLDDGSEVTITKAHKLYKATKWNNQLEKGDVVCVPKKLPHEDGNLSPELANLMGWLVGDGCDSNPNSNRHRFTQKDDDDRNRVKNLIKKITTEYDLEVNIIETRENETHRATSLEICSRSFRDLLVSKGYKWGRLAALKEVPSSVMTATEAAVAAFLQGYFDAEGYVWKERYTIEISSASHLLMKQVACLLRRFGIWLRLRKKRARATNGKNIWRDYWVGTIGGPSARLFRDKIGFSVNYKREDLDKFLEVTPNSNVEGIPASKILREITEYTGIPQRHITGSYTVYMRGTQEPSRETLQLFVNNIRKILNGTKKSEMLCTIAAGGQGSGRNKAYLPAYESLDSAWLQEKCDLLQQLIDQNVHYVTIADIKEIDYDGWVYDLEVEDYHNYVAENILCHNTGSAICAIHWHKEMGHIDKALVICPKSVVGGWEEQIQMFSNLSFVSITGAKKEDRMKKLSLVRDVYLINYEYTWRIIDDLLNMKFNMIICDEAHRIKDPGSEQSKACYTLGDQAEYRIALTGTPVLNSSLDAFGVMRFVDSRVFGESFYSFRSKYFINISPDNSPIQKYVAKHGADETISDKMYSRALRFLKEECLDLPKLIAMPDRVVSLSPEQDQAYRRLRDDLCAEIMNNKQIRINHVLTLMLKLNQVTSGWIKDSDTGEIIHFKSNPKLEELKTIVEEAGDQPIILWAYYIEDMKLLTSFYGRCQKCKEPTNFIKEENCPKCGTYIKYRCSEVQGSTKYRNAEIARFRFTPEERSKLRKKLIEEGKTPQEIRAELGDLLPDGSEPPQSNLIINQIVAASEGLNLQRASMAIFYSRNWSLKDWSQALARNHRQGQTKPVTYVNIVAQLMDGEDTVDQRIANALKKKEDLSKKINKDDLKLLMGNFKKAEREAFKEIEVVVDEPNQQVVETELQAPSADNPSDQNEPPGDNGSAGLLF